MKIVSIEPTPSPNVMKLNLDESLPPGKDYRYSKKEAAVAEPAYLKRLLAIEGVTGVFQVLDFISLERHPKADWQQVLAEARLVMGDAVASDETEQVAGKPDDPIFQEIVVQVQQVKGIPLQVKLQRGTEEQRFGLSERFTKAVMQVQETVTNHIFDRKWVEQRPRYGDLQEVGQQVVEEIEAAYDQERLARLIERAFHPEEVAKPTMGLKEVEQALQNTDWKVRFRALEQLEPDLAALPLLKKALQDEKVAIRRQAVVVLGWLESEEALPLLYQGLQDRSPIVRRTAGDCLSDLGFPAAIPAMCQALQDENKLVRWRAARFLYEVGDEQAIEALRQALNDPEFEVRMQAQIALERIEKGEKASGTVWQQMTRREK